MLYIEAAREVVSTKTAHLVRERKAEPGQFDAKPMFTGNKRGWIVLDLFSASALVSVHDALNEQNRAKLLSLPLRKALSVAFKLLK